MNSALLFGSLLLAATPLPWQVAAPDWQLVGAQPGQALLYADHLNQELADQDFRVVSPGEIASRLTKDQREQLQQCGIDRACLARMGRAIGADAVLSGRMRQFEDGSVTVVLSVISTADGREVARTEASGGNADQMIHSLDAAALSLRTGIETSPPATPGPPGLPPSASLSATPQRREAWIPVVNGGIAATIGSEMLIQSQTRFRNTLVVRDTGPTLEDINRQVRSLDLQARRAQALGFTGVGLGTASLVGAGMQYLLASKSPFMVEPFVSLAGAGIGFSGSF